MDDLAALRISHERHEHPAVFTVAESSALEARLPGADTKNLFLKDVGGAFWLLTVPSAAPVDLKALPGAIGCKRVSFAKPDDMERLLGVSPGSVTPLAMINAPPGKVAVVIENSLAMAERVNVHPLRNTATVALAGSDILRLLRNWGHEPMTAKIPTRS